MVIVDHHQSCTFSDAIALLLFMKLRVTVEAKERSILKFKEITNYTMVEEKLNGILGFGNAEDREYDFKDILRIIHSELLVGCHFRKLGQ